MSDLGRGGRFRRRRVRVAGDAVAEVVASLAEALGLDVVSRASDADLVVLETMEPAEVERLCSAQQSAPILVVASERLRSSTVAALRQAGAARVLDAEACLLELAIAFSELLFDTSGEQRRYAKEVGGLNVSFSIGDRAEEEGRTLVLQRSGALIESTAEVAEGVAIVLTMFMGGRSIPVRGRVACLSHEGFGVEFAMEDSGCSPRLYALPNPSNRPKTGRRVIRATS